jgi:hypothetical protein
LHLLSLYRCRPWYDTGRKLFLNDSTPLYVTAPYLFAAALEDRYGQSATSPLFDPQTGDHVGQVLVDFTSDSVFTALDSENTALTTGGFPILINMPLDRSDGDSVIGPGLLRNDSAKPISQLVLPHDHKCTSSEEQCALHLSEFEAIVDAMKNGESGVANFSRTTEDGETERLYMGYAPVELKGLLPVDSSDFSSGVEQSDILVYSLGLAQTEEGMLFPFIPIEDQVEQTMAVAITVLCIVVFLAIALVVLLSRYVAIRISGEMLLLLDLIKGIQRYVSHSD